MSVTCPHEDPSASHSEPPTLLYHFLGIAIAMCLMGVIDKIALQRIGKKWFGAVGPSKKTSAPVTSKSGEDKATKARWFALHSIVNLCIVGFSLPDCLTCLLFPACAMMEPMYSYVPSYLAFGVHAYHFVGYSDLRAADVVHHLLFPLPMGIVDFTMHWGPIVNFLLFFMTGLPGGIDYGLLSLVKIGHFDRLEEKRINAHMNIWLRCPGLVVVAATIWTCLIHGNIAVHPIIVGVMCILTFGNGVYYGQQVVRNYEEERGLQISREQIKKGLSTPHHYPLPAALVPPESPMVAPMSAPPK